MLISVLQDSFRPGALEENIKKIKAFYKKASENDVDVAVVPAEALCGFDPDGLLEFPDFSDRLTKLQKQLIRETNSLTALVFDTPLAIDGSFSPSLIVAYDGCIHHSVSQFRSETADLRDNIVELQGHRVLIAPFSSWSAMHMLMSAGIMETVDLAILLDARAFTVEEERRRCETLTQMAGTVDTMIYASQSGAQERNVLVGASAVYANGGLRMQLPYFESGVSMLYDLEKGRKKRCASICPDTEEKRIACIHDALVCGIRDYFKNSGIQKAVLGLSGGIDSAVVLPLAVAALGRQNVFGIMMPSQFSTEHSVKDAVQSAENLQVYYEIIPIEPLYKAFMKQLSPVFKGTPFGLAEENLQARIRGNILMSVANKMGAMVLNTSNKSESACGYGTMYGDLCGGLSVLGDLYKSEVYALARYINRKKEIIPENSLTKAPSAELRPGQKDSDSLPDYDSIERVLRLHLEQKKDEKSIVREGIDKETVKKILNLFYKNEYKRRQAPPAIRVSNTVLTVDITIPVLSR